MKSGNYIDVLREPHRYFEENYELLINVLKNSFGEHAEGFSYSRSCTTTDCILIDLDCAEISINISRVEINEYGLFNIFLETVGYSNYLEKHFKYPLLPTEEEKTLFEIENGIAYPIKTYKEDIFD